MNDRNIINAPKDISYNNNYYKTRVWIMTSDRRILIKNYYKNHLPFLEVQDLTIESNDLTNALRDIESKCGLLIVSDDLKNNYLEYQHNGSNQTSTETYFLNIELSKEERKIIEENFGGKFHRISTFIDTLNQGMEVNPNFQKKKINRLFKEIDKLYKY